MLICMAASMSYDRRRHDHEQPAQVAVALFGDRAHSLFAAGRVLPWHQPDPGCKLASRLEDPSIRNAREACGSRLVRS